MIVIFHFNMRDLGAYQPRKVEQAKELWSQGGRYDCVASVDTLDLEVAFEKTNHIVRDWTENDGVRSFHKLNRSTSVGDIAMHMEENKLYFCAPVGWEEMSR